MGKGDGGEPGKRQCRGGSNNTRTPAELSALSGQAITRVAPSFCLIPLLTCPSIL